MTPRFRILDGDELYYPPYPDNVFLGTDKEGNVVGKVQRENAGGVRTVILPDVMLSTGLTDAEGTEIWEGDVLDVTYWDDTEGRLVVEWQEEVGQWSTNLSDGEWVSALHHLVETDEGRITGAKHIEVIGNVYEHDLLA